MKKDDLIGIRISSEYKQIIKEAAELEDRSISYYVSRLIEKEVERLLHDKRLRHKDDDPVK